MKIHHLNCGTMKTLAGSLVAHVLLVEGPDGLVLVDTGFGLEDIADPTRIGPARRLIGAVLEPAETAARQVEALGFARTDVRHIVLTHFDVDHIGGLADFPSATVHVTADEARAAIHSPSRQERFRYRARQWAHGPHLVEHVPSGDRWRGFAAAAEVIPGIALIALPGHTRGHAAVAVQDDAGWLLHAGDAFFDHGSVDGTKAPFLLATYEKIIAFDRAQVRDNHSRLAELWARREPDLRIICAHDPTLLP